MAKFLSVLLASIQYAFGLYLFKKPDLTACGPLVSSLAVLTALFLVLWSLPLYPRKLRKLTRVGNYIAQYLIAAFFIEYLMGCFWFPLEAAVLVFLPKMASVIEETFLQLDMPCQTICEALRKEGTGMFMSYLLSFLILLAAMHATRIINLTLLFTYGITPFLYDINKRVQRFAKSFPTNIGVSYSRFKTGRPPYCSDEDTFEFEPGYDAAASTDSEYPYRSHSHRR